MDSTNKKLIVLGLPTIILQMIRFSSFFVATLLIGRISAVQLGAMGLAFSYYIFFILLGAGTTVATGVQISYGFGANDKELIQKNFRNSIWMVLMIAVVLMIFLHLSAPYFHLTGQDSKHIYYASHYLSAISWAVPPILITNVFTSVLLGLQVPARIYYLAIIHFLITMAAYYVFIYGHFGFPAMGMVGAGYAMSVSAWLTTLCAFLFVVTHKKSHHYHVFAKFWQVQFSVVKKLFILGFPIGLCFGLDSFMISIMMFFYNQANHMALGAEQIALQLQFYAMMFPTGVGQGATILSSYLCGQNNFAKLPELMHKTLWMAVLSLIVFSAIYVAFPDALVKLFIGHERYVKSPDFVHLAAIFIIIKGVLNIFEAIFLAGLGYLRGLKDVFVPLFQSLMWLWVGLSVLCVISLYVLHLGAVSIALSGAICVAGAAGSVYLRMRKVTKRLLTRHA